MAAFLRARRHFIDDLTRMGHRVVYLRLDDPKNEQAFDANLIRLIREQRIARFEYMQPDVYRLDRQLVWLDIIYAGHLLRLHACIRIHEPFWPQRTPA